MLCYYKLLYENNCSHYVIIFWREGEKRKLIKCDKNGKKATGGC